MKFTHYFQIQCACGEFSNEFCSVYLSLTFVKTHINASCVVLSQKMRAKTKTGFPLKRKS